MNRGEVDKSKGRGGDEQRGGREGELEKIRGRRTDGEVEKQRGR